MNVKEAIQAEIAKLEAELASLPEEVHTLETGVWDRIKAFFASKPPVTPA